MPIDSSGRANLWRQWDLLFSIHGLNYAYTHTHTQTERTHKCKPIQTHKPLCVLTLSILKLWWISACVQHCIFVCICVCKDVVKSADSEDNGWPYGLMSGSLAQIYVVCANVLRHNFITYTDRWQIQEKSEWMNGEAQQMNQWWILKLSSIICYLIVAVIRFQRNWTLVADFEGISFGYWV